MSTDPCYDPLGANDPDFVDPLGVNENPWDRERRLAAEGSSQGSQGSVGSPDDNDILTHYSTNSGEFREGSVCGSSSRRGSDSGSGSGSGCGRERLRSGSGSSTASSHARYSWIYPSDEDLSLPMPYAGDDDTHRAWHPTDGGEVPSYIYQGGDVVIECDDPVEEEVDVPEVDVVDVDDQTLCFPTKCNIL